MTNRTFHIARLSLPISVAVCAVLAGTSASSYAADAASSMMHQSAPASGKSYGETAKERIMHLHDELKITADQEVRWQSVAQVMLDNASAINDAVKGRAKLIHGMTAVDDLRTYEAVVDAHANGIRKLAAAFKPLYDSMPVAQQKNADAVFGHRTDAAKLKARG
jgi:protein CpxP